MVASTPQQSGLSYERYQEVKQFLEDYRNSLFSGDMGSGSSEIDDAINNTKEFMDALENLFKQCVQCNRRIGLDEVYEIQNEEFLCKNCSEDEGG